METNEENNFAEETAPAPADYETTMHDEDEDLSDRIDFSCYPGVKKLYSNMTALLVLTTIVPAVLYFIGLFGLQVVYGSLTAFGMVVLLIVLLQLGLMAILITASRRAIRRGSSNAIFLTHAACYWSIVYAIFSIIAGIKGPSHPSIGTMVGICMQLAVVAFAVVALVRTRYNTDVNTLFPRESRISTAADWITVIATILFQVVLHILLKGL
ncbi:MAG TPA: hypothetical protein DC009_02020 [Porphyromonadaceae bacterium]|nr:hypothetical protein [Porphyromonadaceae bacterium]